MLVAFALGWLCCGPALGGTRVALVIGNSAYQHVPVLSNLANNAADEMRKQERRRRAGRHRIARPRPNPAKSE